MVNKQIGLTDEQIAQIAQRYNDPNKATGLKKHFAPVLEANIGKLSSFPSTFQNLLLEVNSRLTILNEEVEQYRIYFHETFSSSLSEANREIINQNIEVCYASIADQTEFLCGLIERVLGE